VRRDAFLWLAVSLGGCGYVGYPLPPAGNIPLPIANVKASQIGDKMIVEFTEPLITTEGLPIKRLGGLDVRIGQKIDPFSAGVWAEKAKPVPAKLSETGIVTVDVPVKDWIGQDVIIGVRTTNVKGKASTWSNFANLHVAAAPAVPTGLHAESDPHGSKLTWTGSSPSYRVFRKLPGDKEGAQIGEPTEASFVDETAEYDKKYVYWVVAVDGGARSPESETYEFTSIDKFAPATPSGVTAIIGPVSVELAWESNIEPDLRGYRVYRSVGGAEPERLAEVASPAFSDKKPVAGKKHSYTITAIDKRDNESAKSAAVEVDVP
jgi:fibronectin type 3 domain-containing protein